jgi:signal transduction histidine kinase
MKIKPGRMSLSSSPFYASLGVIISLGVFMAIFWAFNEYEAYTDSIENIRQSYRTRYRARVKEELDKVVDFVEYKRSQVELGVESEIRERVQAAYSIASHMYSQHKDEMERDELRALVVEVLRPIRWNNGRGYYFAGRVESTIIDLYADDPYFEGKTTLAYGAEKVNDKISDIIDIIREKGAGVYRYNWTKPEFVGRSYPKVSFVKYFKPFDWYIGAGIYLDDREKVLQEDVLERIRNIHFSDDGEVFGFRFDSTIVCHSDERLIGRSVKSVVGHDDFRYGEAMWQAGLSESGEEFISYSVKTPEKTYQKLSYVKAYKDWGMVFVTSMSMDEMERAIEDERRTYLKITFKNITLFIALFIVAVSLLLLIAYFYSLRIKQGISLFTNFFRKAADEKIRIEVAQLAFAEFEDLGNLANHMVDDRIQKERLLRRDELRLDTLLQLGMMDDSGFQEKYNFILERIIEITRSEGGYLALVNTTQTHLNLYSFFDINGDNESQKQEVSGISKKVEAADLPGEAVLQKRAIINNSCKLTASGTFPYSREVRRHLDVPIYNSGKIVIVAGVCNNSGDYDTSDTRQMAMLLEGLWLHVLKMCADEEMARLERQIIAVSEEERSTIGRDLHDDLGSHLSGVELLCKVLQRKLENDVPQRAEELSAIRNLIREAIEITRRLAQGLYPVHVIEHGLESSVEELKVEVENLFDVQCVLNFHSDNEWVDGSIAIHLYYIVREAVFNAARHGRPDNIEIRLVTGKKRLQVEVIDDGCGFSEESTQKGIGLHTMKYRAKAIDAALTISSDTGRGTRIVLQGEVQS